MDSRSAKSRIRKRYLAQRNSIAPDRIQHASKVIKDNFIGLTEEHGFNVIMVYLSIGSEIETYELSRELIRMGKTICAPVVERERKTIVPYSITKLPDHLVNGHYNIPEPCRQSGKPINPRTIDAILVPGIVFDRRGYRIGYGGGYYDRFIPLCDDPLLVGATISDLITDRLCEDEWDMPVDIILTERGTVLPERHVG